MNLSVGQCILLVAAALFIGLGIAFVLYPASLIADTGLLPQTATAMTELRAFYGCFEIAVGVFLAACAWRPHWMSAGLAFLAITAGGLVIGRTLGLWLDGLPQPLTGKLMVVETGIMLVAIYGLYRER